MLEGKTHLSSCGRADALLPTLDRCPADGASWRAGSSRRPAAAGDPLFLGGPCGGPLRGAGTEGATSPPGPAGTGSHLEGPSRGPPLAAVSTPVLETTTRATRGPSEASPPTPPPFLQISTNRGPSTTPIGAGATNPLSTHRTPPSSPPPDRVAFNLFRSVRCPPLPHSTALLFHFLL